MKNPEGNEIQGIKNILEKEINYRFTQTDNICSKLIKELIKRIVNLEEVVNEQSSHKKIMLKQKKEFFAMKRKLMTDIENILGTIKPNNKSKGEHKNIIKKFRKLSQRKELTMKNVLLSRSRKENASIIIKKEKED